MPYIKSHSNYVLKSKHQDIKDGTIYERDITTIGGLNQFSKSQIPIYKSSNFIITVRNDGRPSNQYNTEKWKENESGGTIWTLENISGMTSNTDEGDDTKIVLKQDYYDLGDFAYYGSLTELFRASVTDIIDRFPGELYATSAAVYYTSAVTIDFERIEDRVRLGKNNYNLCYVSNPFGINIHSNTLREGADPLKYFAKEGYKNYIMFSGDTYDVNNESVYTLNEWDSTWYFSEPNPNGDSKYIRYTASTTSDTVYSATSDTYYPCKGDKMADINLRNNNGLSGKVEAWIGDNDEIIYLASSADTYDIHIRPSKDFYDAFYYDCDNFEKLLVDKDTDYKALFSVIREGDNGFYRELVEMQFPTDDGDYNLDASSYGFNDYTTKMIKIGEFYDENFTDNLWRSMTHEAIKNFDWTYTREFNEGDEEEYVFGGQRIQKALRIFGREFDEMLSYIENIRNLNRITYDERSNLPDYFLTDTLKDSGWDVKLIYPYEWKERYESGINKFTQNPNSLSTPYAAEVLEQFSGGYFTSCEECTDFDCCEVVGIQVNFPDNTVSARTAEQAECLPPESCKGGIYSYKFIPGKSTMTVDGIIKNRIKSYTDESNWTDQRANNEFLRRLKINSPYIWRTKGTIDGIEMILGMFGLRSERWVNARNSESACSMSDYDADFSVTEYSSFTNRIEETWDAIHQNYRINWINSTKTISYDNRFISNYNKYGFEGMRTPYQGIPVVYRDEYPSDTSYIGIKSLEDQISGGVTPSDSANCFVREDGSKVLRRYLYPNFEKSEQLDGNPYFQMNGGWLSKKLIDNQNKEYYFAFDVDDRFITSDEPLYKETVRNIRRVNNINELLSIPTMNLYNGVICNVTYIEKNSAVIDGVVYPINKEWDGTQELSYISLVKTDGYIKVGKNKYFDSTIMVYGSDGEDALYNVEEKEDGYEVKAYIQVYDDPFSPPQFKCQDDSDGNYSISSFFMFKNWDGGGLTNYFILDDINYADEIESDDNPHGWRRLSESDEEYGKINTIINYYEGNNPHNGNMVYDNGHEYFTYFKRIFKYASDNELFDGRCYEDLYYTLDNEISNYGFSGLIDDDESILNYDSALTEDTKIHYFGNYKRKKGLEKSDGVPNIETVWIYGEDSARTENYKTIYSNEASVSGYILSADSKNGWIESGTTNPYSNKGGIIDEVTNQIVNNKRLLIKFYLHSSFDPTTLTPSKKGIEEIKYLDEIVMNYLTQLIPSTTILQVEYVSKS